MPPPDELETQASHFSSCMAKMEHQFRDLEELLAKEQNDK